MKSASSEFIQTMFKSPFKGLFLSGRNDISLAVDCKVRRNNAYSNVLAQVYGFQTDGGLTMGRHFHKRC